MTLEPPVKLPAIRKAAMVVQKRYPMLKAVLRGENGDFFFEFGVGKDVEVHEYVGSIEEAVNNDFSRSSIGELCCWHLTLCGPHLLLMYHHSFLDGRSVMFILQDLLDY